jgi:hypothetical protein
MRIGIEPCQISPWVWVNSIMNSSEACPYDSSTFKTSTTTFNNFSVKLLYFNTTSSSSIDDKNDVIAFKDATLISI